MNIYILRHATAIPRGAPGFKDENRPLAKDGQRKMAAIAKGMRALELEFGRILSSPYRRALQTAAFVGKVFHQDVRTWKPLAPTATPRQLIRSLAKVSEDSVLLVGHEPHLSRFISVMVCGNAGAMIELKKGALCKLSSDRLAEGPCARLEWLLTPAQLRKLGSGKSRKPR